MTDQFIERRIVTGLIISTKYVDRIRKNWSSKLLESKAARKIANWSLEFYDRYREAPREEIESIFLEKTKNLSKGEVEDIEDILASLSDEYERQDKFNVEYLYDQTIQYFEESHLRGLIDDVTDLVDRGEIIEAKKKALDYSPDIQIEDRDLDLSSPEVGERVERAFEITSQPVVKYSRQLGKFLNDQLVRGAFVGFMAPEKRGKTFFLLDMGLKAVRQHANVAFFQAGDMTEDQQLKRIAVHLAKRSDKKKWVGRQYEPVRDCIKNQLDDCDLAVRECDFGPFEGKSEEYLRDKVEYDHLVRAYKKNKDYKPCYNCNKYWEDKLGAVWLKRIDLNHVLTKGEAKKEVTKFFVNGKRRFRLSTHPNRTLSVSDIDNTLDLWERKDGFVPDLIIVDYADILAPEIRADFRHQENDKWMKLRGLSQKRHALVVTATQTDASSYDRNTLSLKNFSEDKRKFGHVTAMYGLNQDTQGREKKIGIMRLNKILVREDDFLHTHQVHVLQNLRRGLPCMSSYW